MMLYRIDNAAAPCAVNRPDEQTGVIRKVGSADAVQQAVPGAERDTPRRVRHLFERAAKLDLSRHVMSTTRDELRERLVTPMAALVEATLELASELEAAHEEASADDDFDLDGVFGDEGASSEPAGGAVATTSGPAVLAVCFALRHELEAVRRQLGDGTASHEQLLVACDRARRKLRRGLRALAEALPRDRGEEVALGDDGADRVQSAVAVRYMYTKFREALPPCPDVGDVQAIGRALRSAATALAMLCGDADFAEVRLHDRLLLRDLQKRTLAWGRSPDPRSGVRLYSDILSAADLLRAINMRQELRAHDGALAAELHGALGREGLVQGDFERMFGRMRALRGLDDELDGLLRRAYEGEDAAKLAAVVRDKLGSMLGALRQDPAAAVR